MSENHSKHKIGLLCRVGFSAVHLHDTDSIIYMYTFYIQYQYIFYLLENFNSTVLLHSENPEE